MQNLTDLVPTLHSLPSSLPREGAVDIEFKSGRLIFRISRSAQVRIEDLLAKQRAAPLSRTEEKELDQYEEIDDYLSFLNRLTRDMPSAGPKSAS